MGRFKFTNGTQFWGQAHSVPKRTPEQIAERKRQATLRREAMRELKKNQGKQDE